MDSFLFRFLASLLADSSIAALAGLLLAGRWLRDTADAPKLIPLAVPAGGLVCALALQLLSLAATFTGQSAILDLMRSLPDIVRTHAGGGLCLTLVAAVLLLSLTMGRRSRHSYAVVPALFACLILRSGSGHAATENAASLSQGLQLLHLGSMAIWCGGILISGFFVLPRLLENGSSFVSYLGSLSRWSTWAVGFTALSGVCKTYLASSGGLPRSLATTWGIALAAKISLVCIALLLGYLNRRSLSARSESTLAGRQRSVTILRLEAITMTMVLIVSAALANLPPPGE